MATLRAERLARQPELPESPGLVLVKDEERCLVVVNFSGGTSQALVRVPWDD